MMDLRKYIEEGKSSSAYLKEALNQPVRWYPYTKEVFKMAEKEDKPILIDIGASWCHWCHVMDEESYSDPEIARFLNENFICVKVDRDEMPNIDRKYQEAISALTGEGGWPLTVFALPNGEAFYGGTYFPKEEKFGKPAFMKVLKAVLDSFKKEREKTEAIAEEIKKNLENKFVMGEPNPEMLKKALDSILAIADPVYGGFGFGQKFPMPTAVRFLLNMRDRFNDSLKFADQTLEEMFAGGIHDHIFGGFFRYTVDREWTIPHFEKIVYENGELLITYSIAYRCFGRKIFRLASEGIVDFLEKFLKADLGFYTSVDADFRGEEGGFYTYSFEELKDVLDDLELKAFKFFYNVSEAGNFRGKNHLRIDASVDTVAEEMGISVQDLEEILSSGREKLRRYRYRLKDELKIDKSVYTSYTSIVNSGLIYFGLIFENDTEYAIKNAEKLLSDRFHDILMRRDGMEGLLEDYAFTISMLVDCYTATLSEKYLDYAKELAEIGIKEFYRNNGFYDGDDPASINDLSHRSAVSQMIQNLITLGIYFMETRYSEIAERVLKSYAGLGHGLFDAGYLLSLQSYFRPMVVESDLSELRRLRKYINHNVILKEGKNSICLGDRCMICDETELEKFLREALNVSSKFRGL
ncbi:thioredoxin domain protein [Archaeoglobus sulfaticallidus PM70-1]|uniref:Thioredoxin domain protein n=1 Tax=Archaeoglobus sulfaticallidus PM70-1 TaxID=387631 RepID=N0BIC6_9EURY|nr:thioredoxin domain-containing protein [Archaeoglobus sulfaticallidus]AGK62032.1 thioredoxin domain protein [Archaeoglobus sulfaticallidus PM70-1]